MTDHFAWSHQTHYLSQDVICLIGKLEEVSILLLSGLREASFLFLH